MYVYPFNEAHYMKQVITLLIILFIGSTSYGQSQIELSAVSKHVGDSVRVCGKIYSGRYLENSNGAPTLLNMGAAYPDQLLTLVIYGDNRKAFGKAPELDYKDQEVCVWGKIELFKEKPQIVLTSSRQLVPVHSEH